MAEPVTLYGANGKAQTVTAPSEVRRLIGLGWNLEPPVARETVSDDKAPLSDLEPVNDWGDLNVNLVRTLMAGGYVTPQAVISASDDELLAVKGIGEKALKLLRQELG